MAVLQASNAAARFARALRRHQRGALRVAPAELRANAWLLRPALDLLNVVLLAA